MSLQSYCQKPLIRVAPDTNITEACQLMEQNNVGCLIAEREGRLCGIVTDRDIALRVAGAKRDPDKTMVKDIMTPGPDPHLGGQGSASAHGDDACLSRPSRSDRQRLRHHSGHRHARRLDRSVRRRDGGNR